MTGEEDKKQKVGFVRLVSSDDNPVWVRVDKIEAVEHLYYRKADEVRKETAKEILQDLYDKTFEMKDPYSDSNEAKEVIDRAEILHTAKLYGVEVDE